MQYSDDGKQLYPCGYMSQKLNATQLRKSAYETELWAMIKCLQTWKHYVAGQHIEIRTDHAPLKWFRTQAKLSDKIVRWLDFLSEFDFTIVHVPRTENMAADAFSKTPTFYDDHIFLMNTDRWTPSSCLQNFPTWQREVHRCNVVTRQQEQAGLQPLVTEAVTD